MYKVQKKQNMSISELDGEGIISQVLKSYPDHVIMRSSHDYTHGNYE
jgi:hypothetical protein